MSLPGHVACMAEMRNMYIFWLEILEEIDHSDDIGINSREILEWILGSSVGYYETNAAGLI